jgi:hypothetical protein
MIDQSIQDNERTPEDDMARRARATTSSDSTGLVTAYVTRLKAVGRDREAFERVFSEIRQDTRLAASDVSTIAIQFRGGGAKPGSKKAAIEVISKRFLELVRDHAKVVQAAKARPW